MYKKIYRNMLLLCITTLIIASSLILTVFYTVYNSHIETDLENDTLTICDFLNNTSNAESYLKSINEKSDFIRYTLISPDGNVVYDTSGEYDSLKFHGDRPEIEDALKYGRGKSKRFSESLSTNFYYYAVKLNNGYILRCAKNSLSLMSAFYISFIFILIMIGAICIFSAHIASKLSRGIVTPITNPDFFSEEYDELMPLRKRIENQNREIQRQIEKASHQEHQQKLITDNMNEGLIIIDEKGTVISLNTFAANIFNVREYEVKSHNFSTLTENELFKETIEKALSKKRSDILIEMGELDYRVFCSPVFKEGVLTGVVILLFDVTSTSRSEKLRREFSANVSHELKTPLTSINGYAQLISSGIAEAKDIPEFANKIAKESNRLMLLIEDIMRLSRLDEADGTSQAEDFFIKGIIEDVIASLSDNAKARSISVICTGTDFSVKSNKSQVTELIYNLVDNAIKYNKENGKVTIVLGDKSVSIIDTGIGIAPEYTSRIFERFFRVDKSHSKKIDGTGLGLSIVKHIALANNIDIDVKSELGNGSVFTLKF